MTAQEHIAHGIKITYLVKEAELRTLKEADRLWHKSSGHHEDELKITIVKLKKLYMKELAKI